jgi:hypothetical protein
LHAECRHELRWRRHPDAGASRPIVGDLGVRAVAFASRQQIGSGRPSDGDALLLGLALGDLRQAGDERGIERGGGIGLEPTKASCAAVITAASNDEGGAPAACAAFSASSTASWVMAMPRDCASGLAGATVCWAISFHCRTASAGSVAAAVQDSASSTVAPRIRGTDWIAMMSFLLLSLSKDAPPRSKPCPTIVVVEGQFGRAARAIKSRNCS